MAKPENKNTKNKHTARQTNLNDSELIHYNLQILRWHLLFFFIVDFFSIASLFFFGIQKGNSFFRSAKDKDKGLQATQAKHKMGIGVPEGFLFFSLLSSLSASFYSFHLPHSTEVNNSGCMVEQAKKSRLPKKKKKSHYPPQRYISAHSTERMWLISRANRATRDTQGYR